MESRVRVALLDLRAGFVRSRWLGFVRSRWLGFAHGLTRHMATGTLTGGTACGARRHEAGGKIGRKLSQLNPPIPVCRVTVKLQVLTR